TPRDRAGRSRPGRPGRRSRRGSSLPGPWFGPPRSWSVWRARRSAGPAEQGDLVLADRLALGRVVDALALLGREAQDADLALGLVAVDGERGVADLAQRVHPREQRLDLAVGDELVRGPRLPVVGEVRGDDA